MREPLLETPGEREGGDVLAEHRGEPHEVGLVEPVALDQPVQPAAEAGAQRQQAVEGLPARVVGGEVALLIGLRIVRQPGEGELAEEPVAQP